MVDYAELAELKAARHITDTAHDAALQAALTRASRAIDARTGRRFDLDDAPTSRVYDPRGRRVGDRLLVDDIGSDDGLTVEIGSDSDGWVAVTGYETWPENALARGRPITAIVHPGCWPLSGSARVRVTARWGWPAVPDEIAQATLLLANRLYLRKDSPEGVLGSSEWGVVRLSRWDPDVEALIGPYVLAGFG